jgi:hypothetical protein
MTPECPTKDDTIVARHVMVLWRGKSSTESVLICLSLYRSEFMNHYFRLTRAGPRLLHIDVKKSRPLRGIDKAFNLRCPNQVCFALLLFKLTAMERKSAKVTINRTPMPIVRFLFALKLNRR